MLLYDMGLRANLAHPNCPTAAALCCDEDRSQHILVAGGPAIRDMPVSRLNSIRRLYNAEDWYLIYGYGARWERTLHRRSLLA